MRSESILRHSPLGMEQTMIVLKLNQKAFQEIVQYSVKASVCAQAIQMQKMYNTWVISMIFLIEHRCSFWSMMTMAIVTTAGIAGIAGKVVIVRREVHNNEPHPSLTACTEYTVHHKLNLYFPQVGFQLFFLPLA